MNKYRIERSERPFLPATAAGRGLGCFPLRSPQSRAAARALLIARQESENDGAIKIVGLAERVDEARRRAEEARRRGEPIRPDWGPLPQNPEPGSLAARLVEARARVTAYEVERETAK